MPASPEVSNGTGAIGCLKVFRKGKAADFPDSYSHIRIGGKIQKNLQHIGKTGKEYCQKGKGWRRLYHRSVFQTIQAKNFYGKGAQCIRQSQLFPQAEGKSEQAVGKGFIGKCTIFDFFPHFRITKNRSLRKHRKSKGKKRKGKNLLFRLLSLIAIVKVSYKAEAVKGDTKGHPALHHFR